MFQTYFETVCKYPTDGKTMETVWKCNILIDWQNLSGFFWKLEMLKRNICGRNGEMFVFSLIIEPASYPIASFTMSIAKAQLPHPIYACVSGISSCYGFYWP